MDIKNITGSSYMAWQSQSQQCQTDASVSKSSLLGARKTEKKSDLMAEQCGQGCQSQPYVGTSHWMSGLKEWKPTSHSRGTVHHTTTPLCPLTGVSLAHGYVRSPGSFTHQGIYSQWITPKAKLQTAQPSISRVTLWC